MVQELLPHRTENMIKNRFYGHIKKKYFPKKGKKGKVTASADAMALPVMLNFDDGQNDLFS